MCFKTSTLLELVFLLRLNIFHESRLQVNDKGINNKSKYFFFIKNTKKACITYLTNEYDNSKYIVIKASSFLKVSNSLRNSVSAVFYLDYNMPYGRE